MLNAKKINVKNIAARYLSGYTLTLVVTLAILWMVGVADTGIEWLFSAALVGAELAKNAIVIGAIFLLHKGQPRLALSSREVFFVGVLYGATALVFFAVASMINAAAQSSIFPAAFRAFTPRLSFALKEVTFGIGQSVVIFGGVWLSRFAPRLM